MTDRLMILVFFSPSTNIHLIYMKPTLNFITFECWLHWSFVSKVWRVLPFEHGTDTQGSYESIVPY
jgi:hypothetical protein